MRVVRNIGYVKRRRRWAKWGAVLGGTLLVAAIILPYRLQPGAIGLAYAILLVGFLIFNIGMQQVGKWTDVPRKPRADKVLDRILHELGDRYALIHYARLNKHVVEHLLVHPGGIEILTTREVSGHILAKKNRWRRLGFAFRRLFGLSGPQLGNPVQETEQSIAAVEDFLADRQLELDIDGCVIFLHPDVQLEVDDPDIPAMLGTELLDFVRELPIDPTFKRPEFMAVVQALSQGEELEADEPRVTRRRPVRRRAA